MKTGYLGVQFAEVGVALDNEYFALDPWWTSGGRLWICKISLQVLELVISDLGLSLKNEVVQNLVKCETAFCLPVGLSRQLTGAGELRGSRAR